MISKVLYENIENRIRLSNGAFKTVEEYLTFVLTEVVKEVQDKTSTSDFTVAEEEDIKARLSNLGYI